MTDPIPMRAREVLAAEYRDAGFAPEYEPCTRATANILALRAIEAALREGEAVERRTVERCAKVCEQQAKDFLSPEYAVPQPVGSIQERFACGECAAALRAMAAPSRQTLASLRAAAGMTLRQVETAVQGRFSNALLSQLETGKIKRPSAAVLVDLAVVYGVTTKAIFEAAGVSPGYVSDHPRTDGLGRPFAALTPGGSDGE